MKFFSTIILLSTIATVVHSQDVGNSIQQDTPGCNLEPGAEANRRLAFSIFRTVADRGKKTKNILLAPTTIAAGLAMILAGASGKTKEQIWNGLGFNTIGFTEDDIPCLLKMYSNELIEECITGKTRDANLVMKTAGRLFGEQSCSFNEDFLRNTRNYGAQMQLLDFMFDTEGAIETMNSWVAERTNNRIEELFSPSDIESSTKLAIVSVIYFQGKWKTPFNTEDTYERPFHVDRNTIVEASYMNRDGQFQYFYSERLQADLVDIPYKQDCNGICNVSMILIVPKKPEEFNSSRMVTEENLGQAIKVVLSQKMQRVSLHLPRFTLSEDYDLKPILRRVGIKRMWTPGLAELGGMTNVDGSCSQGIHISSGIHKTFIKVDEEGTEAAGATGAGIVALSLPQLVVCDHPFMILIYEKNTNSILLIGRVGNPAR